MIGSIDKNFNGLIHISEVSNEFVRDINDYVKIDEDLIKQNDVVAIMKQGKGVVAQASSGKMAQLTEIGKYANCDNTRDLEIITSVCEVPGDVDILRSMDIDMFYKYVDGVFLHNGGLIVNTCEIYKIEINSNY